MIQPAFEILNQRGTPMFFSDVFANRPTAGIVGRIFISTDTYAFYRDTGSGWDLIGGPGSGTITGSGTIGTLPIWNGTQVIGDSSLLEGASKFTTTKDFQADGYYLSGMTAGNGALYWISDRVTLANYNVGGSVYIEVNGGNYAQVIAADLSSTFYGAIIRNGGLSTQFLKADGSLDSSTYITTNIYNGNGTLTGNRVVSLNSNYLSFAGGQTYIGSQTTSSGLLTINNSNADAHVQVVGANSPSIRIDNAGTGATRRFVIGLSTATNNFIQGSTAGDICISTASASPMLFGMWQTTNASEVMRISTANNLIIGSSTDNGNRIQVNGNGYVSGNLGLGVVPSAWDLTGILQNAGGSLWNTSSIIGVNQNAYYGGSAWKYVSSANASDYYQTGGQHIWRNAPSGTAGSAITFTQAMTLDASGNLALGTTTTFGRLQISGTLGNPNLSSATATGVSLVISNNDVSYGTMFANYGNGNGALQQRMTNTNTYYDFLLQPHGGNVAIGSNSPVGKLHIAATTNVPSPGSIALAIRDSGNPVFGFDFNLEGVLTGDLSLMRTELGVQSQVMTFKRSNGNVLINTFSDPGQKLYLNGSFRIDGQTSGTAGGNSGQHLIINCDGTTYKIALLNP